MAALLEIRGVQSVLSSLAAARPRYGAAIERGLKKAGLFLQRESQKIVPVQTGNLKNSAFTRNVGGRGAAADVVVGYTAAYAVYVHEDLSKAHGRAFNVKHAAEIERARALGLKAATAEGGMFPRGENQQAKFLEAPARTKRREIMAIISREARKP